MPEPVRLAITLLPLGVFVGLIGSITGVGGGFLIVPFLLLAGPIALGRPFTPEEATGTSLAVVLVNAAAASSAAARRKRIDYRTGLLFAAATLPGAYLGRVILRYLHPGAFAISFAVLLVGVAVYLAIGPSKSGRGLLRGTPRTIQEVTGEVQTYQVHYPAGIVVSFFVGFLASLLGVGGGIIHVPFMVLVFAMPVHIATATSQFILSFTSAVGAVEAAARGKVDVRVLFWMGLGVVAGGQIGVHLAKRVPAKVVRWMLGAILLGVAVSLVFRARG